MRLRCQGSDKPSHLFLHVSHVLACQNFAFKVAKANPIYHI